MATQSQHYLRIAGEIAADVVNDENPQEWRRDRVRARIADTYLLLGRPDLADPYRAGVLESEATSLEAARAAMADAGAFDDRMKVVDELLARGSLDQIRTALETSAQLFDRFYDDQGRRSEAERRVRLAYDKLPIMIRIDLLTRLAESATAHGDPSKAREIIDAVRSAIDGGTWLPEDHVPLLARLATIRHRAGDEVGAQSVAADALALYDQRREEIGTVFRAEALRPLAEAYQAMGDAVNALHIYKRVLADGAENPNGRPRAMDLAATCCSMAVHGVEPDADAWALLRKIDDTLEAPW
jgi:tetratricopeptide (TPR) repeat protein